MIYCHKSCLPTRIQAPQGQRVLSVCPTAAPRTEDQTQNCWWNERGSHPRSPRPPALCSPTLFSTSLNLGTGTRMRRETCKAPKSRSLPPPPSLQGSCLQQGPRYPLRPHPASPRKLTAGLRAQGKDDQRVETLWGGRRKKRESDLTPVCQAFSYLILTDPWSRYQGIHFADEETGSETLTPILLKATTGRDTDKEDFSST